jgi:uncharacterized cofD-like protein
MATNLRRIADPPVSRRRRDKVVSGLKWLYPGMRVKRWLALIPVGLIPVILGVVLLVNIGIVDMYDRVEAFFRETFRLSLGQPTLYIPLGLALIAVGLLVIFAAFVGVNRSIVSAVAPEHLTELPDLLHRRMALSSGARIVAIGGGTGLSTLLRGLKQYTSNLTAVVTMTDDGGSSGQLQKQLMGGLLPPGDVRSCLVALADAEPRMQELFQYRFSTRSEEDGLSGHSFGNLLIAAMTDIAGGDFERAVEETASILNIRGRVLPSTVESAVLVGEMADGTEITGETNIAKNPAAIERIKLCPDAPKPLTEVLSAIRQAEIIVMGPGSVYTSVIPNLLVPEIARAVTASNALKIYVCNVMTQPGESDGFSAADHVKAIEDHVVPFLGTKQRVFDYVLVNTTKPSDELLARYTKSGATFVNPDVDVIHARGYKTIRGSFISESAVVRHDPDKIARAILKLYGERPIFGGK